MSWESRRSNSSVTRRYPKASETCCQWLCAVAGTALPTWSMRLTRARFGRGAQERQDGSDLLYNFNDAPCQTAQLSGLLTAWNNLSGARVVCVCWSRDMKPKLPYDMALTGDRSVPGPNSKLCNRPHTPLDHTKSLSETTVNSN